MKPLLLLVLLVLPICAADPSAIATGDYLAYWQPRLGLWDWKITVKFVYEQDLKKNTLGHSEWDLKKKKADICVLREKPDETEKTVIHELLHLVVAQAAASRHHLEEPLVEALTQELYKQK